MWRIGDREAELNLYLTMGAGSDVFRCLFFHLMLSFGSNVVGLIWTGRFIVIRVLDRREQIRQKLSSDS